ncbi:MAG: hypothetical protein C0502_00345 [Opitutus sp.]|nr:hypothetical protein [Opitutus sp.]
MPRPDRDFPDLRVALISFEFPPAVAIGGIGTYAAQAARSLANHGVSPVVFSAGISAGVERTEEGVTVHRIAAADRRTFAPALVPALLAEHARRPIDLIEAPEIGPEGAEAFAALPSAARVVKLHTPTFLLERLGSDPLPPGARLRFFLGALRRGRWQTAPSPRRSIADEDPECRGARLADEVAAPCAAIAELVGKEWSLPTDRLSIFPLPYSPPAALLALDPPEAVRTVGFLGRLEPRKGVLEMAEAIPQMLRAAPHLRFRFIGPSWPFQGGDMRAWIERRLTRHRAAMEFTGAVSPGDIPAQLARCDAVVLPSRWENFPYACWESLAAARVVIGSAAGGMADVIEPGVSGLLIPPRAPAAIAAAVLSLLGMPGRCGALAAKGRARVLELLAPERVLPLQLASYARARARAGGRASPGS